MDKDVRHCLFLLQDLNSTFSLKKTNFKAIRNK
jgi:hypothetical protein